MNRDLRPSRVMGDSCATTRVTEGSSRYIFYEKDSVGISEPIPQN